MGESAYFIGSYIISLVLAMKAIQNHKLGQNKIINFIGKELSLYVYIYHIAIGKILDLLASKYHLWNNRFIMNSRVFIILFFSLLLAYLIYKIKDLIKKNVLKHKGSV